MWWEYLKAVLVIILIIAAAYYVTKFVAKRAGGPRGRSAEIRVRSSAVLGRDRQLVLVEIGKYVYILGVTAQHVELIDKVSREELDADLPEEKSTQPAALDFKQEFWRRFRGTYHDPRP